MSSTQTFETILSQLLPPKLFDIVKQYSGSDLYTVYLGAPTLIDCIYQHTFMNGCGRVGRYSLTAIEQTPVRSDQNQYVAPKFSVQNVFREYVSVTDVDTNSSNSLNEIISEGDDANRELAKDLLGCKTRIVVVYVSIALKFLDGHVLGHGMVLLFDKTKKIVEHFDPDWSKDTNHTNMSNVVRYHLKKLIRTYFWDYVYIEPRDTCPILLNASLQRSIDTKGAHTYCAMWSLLYALHRITSPDTGPHHIIQMYLSLPKPTLKLLIESVASYAVATCFGRMISQLETCCLKPSTLEIVDWLHAQSQLLSYEQTKDLSVFRTNINVFFHFNDTNNATKSISLNTKTGVLVGNTFTDQDIGIKKLQSKFEISNFIGTSSLDLTGLKHFENWLMVRDIGSMRSSCILNYISSDRCFLNLLFQAIDWSNRNIFVELGQVLSPDKVNRLYKIVVGNQLGSLDWDNVKVGTSQLKVEWSTLKSSDIVSDPRIMYSNTNYD